MLNVLYTLEALRNKNIMLRTSTWVNQNGNRTIAYFFLGFGSKCLTCDIFQKCSGIIRSCQDFFLGEPERIQNESRIFIFGYGSKCKTCYISENRSSIKTSCQDFYLGEPERIQNNCLIFFFRLRIEKLNVLYILEAVRHINIMPGLLPG